MDDQTKQLRGQILLERIPDAPVDATDPYLPVEEIARKYEVNAEYVRGLVVSHKVVGVEIDGDWFVTGSAFAAFKNGYANGAQPAARKSGAGKGRKGGKR